MRNKQKKLKIFALAGAAAVFFSIAMTGVAFIITKKTDVKENMFTPASISLNVVENGNDSSGMTLTWEVSESENKANASKIVQIKNVYDANKNNADAYIRAALIPHWARTETFTVGMTNKTVIVDVTNTADDDFYDFCKLTDVEIDGNHSYQVNADICFQLYTGACEGVTQDENAVWSDYWIWNPADGYFYYKYAVAPGEKTYPLLDCVTFTNAEKLNSVYKGLALQIDVLADAIQTEGSAVSSQWGEDIGITAKTDDSGSRYLELVQESLP